jgi:MFS transporter, UMF1 family
VIPPPMPAPFPPESPPRSPHLELDPTGRIRITALAPRRERFAWALYDFANTIFSMNVITLYFAVWFIEELKGSASDYALATSLSAALVALSVPILGAISDARRVRKPWVMGFTLGCCAATALLGIIGHGVGAGAASAGLRVLLLLAFVAANACFQGALPFYNAMLPELAPPAAHGRLSGYGTALGYLGAIAGVIAVAPFVSGGLPLLGDLPAGIVAKLRTLPFTAGGGRAAAFVPTAFLFLLFALPLFVFCRDHLPVPRAERRPLSLREPLRQVIDALRDTRHYPGLRRFVIASYFYQDVLGTIVAFMAVYAVVVMGFEAGAEATFFVILTVPAVAGSVLTGHLVDRFGPRRTLLGVLILWAVLLLAVVLAQTRLQFWIVGAWIGLVFGGVWAAERPLLLTLVPAAESGRFFGLLVLSARAAAIAGPLLWALIVDRLGPTLGRATAHRLAVAALLVLVLVAISLLRGVPERSPQAERTEAA